MEILPNLDLFNFTDPLAGESQYILTSPRSLEACSRFGIKPVELLPKTADEFEEEYGILTENPSVIYKKSEKERLRKLRLCRQERERIIEEKNLLGTGAANGTISGDENGDSENMPSLSSAVFQVTDSPKRNKNLWRDSLRENVSPRRSPRKIKDKPSILDYLNATTTSSSSPRMSMPLSLEEEDTYKHCTTYDALSDSAICPANDIEKRKKQNKVKRSQSSRTKRDLSLLSLDDDLDTLPKNMKGSQSRISAKDKEILDMYLLKEQSNALPRECVQCWTTETKPAGNTRNKMAFNNTVEDTVLMNQSLGRKEKLRKEDKDIRLKEAKDREARLDREVDIINCRASKWQEKYRKQMQKMDEKLNSIQKDRTEGRVRKFGNEIPSNNANTEEHIKYRPNHRAKSPTRLSCQTPLFHDSQRKEKQSREEHLAQLSGLEEKHKRAGETFQQRMKQKIQQRELNKMKTQERKEFQERQLSVMERDLELWQKELKNYQEICAARADKLVQKKHAITSLKTHQKRHEREVDHAMMKSKVDEEAKLRQEELETLVNIKDERSKMIISAKEEFANAGRDSALMTRAIKDRVSDKKLKSSFDKMAYNGAVMSRLERIPSQRKSQPTSAMSFSKQRKNQSVLTLG